MDRHRGVQLDPAALPFLQFVSSFFFPPTGQAYQQQPWPPPEACVCTTELLTVQEQ